MPDPYPDAAYVPTALATAQMRRHNIDINEVITLVKNFDAAWPGKQPGQTWHQGDISGGLTLGVLIQFLSAQRVKIITLRLQLGAAHES